MKACQIRMEYGKAPKEGICIVEGRKPLFSWAVQAKSGEEQRACRGVVRWGAKTMWDTGWIFTSEQSLRYQGEELAPGETYEFCLWVRGEEGEEGEPETRRFCLGTLKNWDAPWLCEETPVSNAVVCFTTDFTLRQQVASACLFVCGLGYHKAYLNGAGVWTDPLNPAYSEYEKRSYYTVVPGLEKFLRPGKNRLGIRVASGWRDPENECYRLVNRVAAYTGKTQVSAMLRLRYPDGSVEWRCTGRDWRYFYDFIQTSSIFQGERSYSENRKPGWSQPEGELPPTFPAALTQAPCKTLCPQTLEPVREKEIVPAQQVIEVAPGVWSVDFGRNVAGVCRLRLPDKMPKGCEITIRHAETLDEEGRLYTAPLRGAASTDSYIAAGDQRDLAVWQPEFTYHGFRYVEVTGYPGVLSREAISAVCLYTDVALESRFTCGSALINAIYQACIQTERDNIQSILTDCPQRDERMGWMNDATVRFEAVPYDFDVGRLFPKVVRDCMDVQDSQGRITCTAPFGFGARPADPVCSAYLIAGWQAWLHTGNEEILREGYEGFCAWNEYLAGRSENGIIRYGYYGDWAAPAYACVSEENASSAVTPVALLSTGYWYYNSRLLMRIAEIIGKGEDAARHREQAERTREAFLREWWNPQTGCVGTGSQGCQAFALWLDILPLEGRSKAAAVLHRDLVENDFRFTTGNLCTRYLMDTLSRFGYLEDAWAIATREEYPSIGYMLQNEATTIWERFELKKSPEMNSHNHPMYGAVRYWYYGFLAGLRPTDAGWKRFLLEPYLPQKLLSASASVETPYGQIAVRWVKQYGEIHVYLHAPYGTQADVRLPWGLAVSVGPGFHHWHTVWEKKEERTKETEL